MVPVMMRGSAWARRAVRVAYWGRRCAALGPGADRVCPTPVAERKAADSAVRGVGMTLGVREGRAQEEPERWKGARYCGWVGGHVVGHSWMLGGQASFWAEEARGRRRRIFSKEKWDKNGGPRPR